MNPRTATEVGYTEASVFQALRIRTCRIGVGRQRADCVADGPFEDSLAHETTGGLLQRAKKGDRAALGRIYERNLPPLRRWAAGRLPPWARDLVDTDDLVQQTLLDTLKTIGSFVPRHDGALQAYARQALKNRIHHEIQRVRRRPASTQVDPGELADHSPSPLERTIGREQLENYESALSRLPEAARQVVVMRIELDCSYAEIADALGKPSADAARMAVNRALLKLAEEMTRDE